MNWKFSYIKGREAKISHITLDAYRKAHRDILIKDSKKGFKGHVISCVVMNGILTTSNL